MRERLDDLVVRVLNTVLRVIAVIADLPPLPTEVGAPKRLREQRLTPTPTRITSSARDESSINSTIVKG
jgi:hypothetical protein